MGAVVLTFYFLCFLLELLDKRTGRNNESHLRTPSVCGGQGAHCRDPLRKRNPKMECDAIVPSELAVVGSRLRSSLHHYGKNPQKCNRGRAEAATTSPACFPARKNTVPLPQKPDT